MSTLHHVQTTSTTTSSSTVRPRATRLISGLSDANELDSAIDQHASSASTPFDSRSASPIPSAHPQRSTSRQPVSATSAPKFAGSSWGRRAQLAAQKYVPAESPTLAGMWGTSWSTLQGLASEFLGNEEEEPLKEGQRKRNKKGGQQQTPFQKWYQQTQSGRGLSPAASAAGREWGPPRGSSPATTSVGTGTKQEREAALRAQKRKDMLLRQDSSYADALGKFKRRLSDDYESSSVPPRSGNGGDGEDEGAPALVYIHHVQKDDTMAGISLKYNCSANVLRKANRMWSNDTPQSRQTLVIPVDACAVKGRPVADPSSPSIDLLASEMVASPTSIDEPPTPKATQPNGKIHTRASSLSTNGPAEKEDGAWHHDSWVQLPNFSKPTEIGRLSRRALGYFPPARRKSETFSSRGNTPSASLDIPRDTLAAAGRAEESSRSPQRPRRGHQRRLSNASNGYFPSYLSGPGGVGTMNKNVRTPGPAQDGLNKIFAKHLPDVAPPKNQVDLYHPDLPLTTYSDDYTPSASGIATPIGGGGNMSFENMGGALESWVRKLATKATTPSASQAKARAARASVGTPGKGAGGIGDLIEMTDEFELGVESDEEEEAERGRQKGSAGYLSQQGGEGKVAGVGDGKQSSQSSQNWWKGGKGD